jgi:gluconate kinase
MAKRTHEYMPASLLDSQFATLEVPAPDENVLSVDIREPVETIASHVVKQLGHLKTFKRWQ